MIIGITGGIGSGKSTIARELARRGYRVYDCDAEAQRIIAENHDVQAPIVDLPLPMPPVIPMIMSLVVGS